MKDLRFNTEGVLMARYDTDLNPDCVIPDDAVEVTDELFYQAVNDTEGVWKRDPATGDIAKHPFPPPTADELIAQKMTVLAHCGRLPWTGWVAWLGVPHALATMRPLLRAMPLQSRC